MSGSDAHSLLGYLFADNGVPRCQRAADADGDGMVTLFDAFLILRHLVAGAVPPCAPFPTAGEDGQKDPPCDDVTVIPPLEDSEAAITVSDATAAPDGRTFVTLSTTNSTAIAGYFVTIRLEGARFGEAIQVTDLSGTFAGGFAGAEVLDGRMRVGFLCSIDAQSSIPPGDDQPVLEISACLEGGLESGDYRMVIEDAELADFESGRAILPQTEDADLEVPDLLADTGCVSPPAPEIAEWDCPRSEPPEVDPPGPIDGFVRGDANLDGHVSMADALTIRSSVLSRVTLPCQDAADTNDDGEINLTDAIGLLVYLNSESPAPAPPAPFPERGSDPTPDNLGCDSVEIVPPNQDLEDIVSLGEVEAIPGQLVDVPVTLSNLEPIDALQLVLRADPPRFRAVELVPNPEFVARADFQSVRSLPGESGVFVVILVPALFSPGGSIPPGDERLVFSVRGEVAPEAEPGSRIELHGADGLARAGDGDEDDVPLRSELVSREEIRLPEVLAGWIRVSGGVTILRGDANHDSTVNIADAVSLLNHLFSGSEAPRCADEADANDDGRIDIADAIAILSSLFDGSVALPPPFPDSGVDATDDDLPDCDPSGRR